MKALNEPSIAHITLNTGDIAVVPKTYLTDHADLTEMFKALVKDGGGRLPSQPHISFNIVNQSEGVATLSIEVNKRGCVIGTVCCNPDQSKQWWNHLVSSFRRSVMFGAALTDVDMSPIPPHTPWLGVVILLTCESLDAETLGLLAAIEEDIAISYLELQRT